VVFGIVDSCANPQVAQRQSITFFQRTAYGSMLPPRFGVIGAMLDVVLVRLPEACPVTAPTVLTKQRAPQAARVDVVFESQR
jgi:hypothetical protein